MSARKAKVEKVYGPDHVEKQRAARERFDARAPYTGKPGERGSFSDHAPDGACPRCGGTEFTAKRSMVGKLSFGVFAVKSQVRCVTCGLTFKRG